MDAISSLPVARQSEAGACGDWSVKDILSHLHAWHELFFSWYREGMAGCKPAIPSQGFSWKDTPSLNEKIYQDNKDLDYSEVVARLKESHRQAMGIVENHTDTELWTKRLYAWTGSTSLGAYLVGSLSSHYEWASGLVRKWQRGQANAVRDGR